MAASDQQTEIGLPAEAPDVLHLGCGEDHHQDATNVDIVEECNPDEVVDLNETPWPWPDDSVREIRAYHVFEHLDDVECVLRECARILRPSGRLVTAWPIGIDARADPDHERVWTWRTPEFYCGKRHWDVDVGLSVVDRDVTLWSHRPGVFGVVATAFYRWQLRRNGPGPWCFGVPMSSGELQVVFEA